MKTPYAFTRYAEYYSIANNKGVSILVALQQNISKIRPIKKK